MFSSRHGVTVTRKQTCESNCVHYIYITMKLCQIERQFLNKIHLLKGITESIEIKLLLLVYSFLLILDAVVAVMGIGCC